MSTPDLTLTTEPSARYVFEHGPDCEWCQEVKAKYSGTEAYRWSREHQAFRSVVSFGGRPTHEVMIVPMRADPWVPFSRIARKLTAPLRLTR